MLSTFNIDIDDITNSSFDKFLLFCWTVWSYCMILFESSNFKSGH